MGLVILPSHQEQMRGESTKVKIGLTKVLNNK